MSKNKSKKTVQRQQMMSPRNLIIQRGRTYPVIQCLIDENGYKNGLASIVVVRKMGGDKVAFGSYMVDIFCLGVKDTMYHIMTEDEKDDFLEDLPMNMTDCDFMRAQNIIYGALEYAEDLGFQPQKDFEVSKYLLDDVESIEYIEMEFGKNGKPLYVAGPFDNVGKITATLRKSVGEGNFEIVQELDDFDDEEEDYDDRFDFESKKAQAVIKAMTPIQLTYYNISLILAQALDEIEDLEEENDVEEIYNDNEKRATVIAQLIEKHQHFLSIRNIKKPKEKQELLTALASSFEDIWEIFMKMSEEIKEYLTFMELAYILTIEMKIGGEEHQKLIKKYGNLSDDETNDSGYTPFQIIK